MRDAESARTWNKIKRERARKRERAPSSCRRPTLMVEPDPYARVNMLHVHNTYTRMCTLGNPIKGVEIFISKQSCMQPVFTHVRVHMLYTYTKTYLIK